MLLRVHVVLLSNYYSMCNYLFEITQLNLLLYNVQDYSAHYNNAGCPLTCVGWHFTHM